MPVGVDLHGRVALVTGGSRGIGRAVALALAEAGADVAVNYRARAEAAEQVATAIRALGRRAVVVGADVAAAAEVAAMVARVERDLGAVDVLVNNAGIAIAEPGDRQDEATFDRTMATNVKSAFLCTEAVLPAMRARGWGRIVNLSSTAARSAGVISPAYNTSKAALEGMARGYAARVAKHGITVNAVAPGPTDTDMGAPLRAGVAARVPLARMGTPEEVALAVLMTVGNGFMTGQTVAVNGGVMFI